MPWKWGLPARLRPPVNASPELRDAWRHAVATAGWARVIAAWRRADPHRVFLGGLFHSAGRQARLRGVRAGATERCIVDAIVRAWRLPAVVAACIRHHRRFHRAPSFRRDVATVNFASALARHERAASPGALACLGLTEADDVRALAGADALVQAYVGALTAWSLPPCT